MQMLENRISSTPIEEKNTYSMLPEEQCSAFEHHFLAHTALLARSIYCLALIGTDSAPKLDMFATERDE